MVHDDSLTRSLVDTGSAARSPFLELTRSDPRGGRVTYAGACVTRIPHLLLVVGNDGGIEICRSPVRNRAYACVGG